MHRWFFGFILTVLCLATLPGTPVHAQAHAGISLNAPQVWRLLADRFPDGKQRWGALLSVELGRQAILMSARDELGLRTLDASLGESVAPGYLDLTLELEMFPREGSKVRLLSGNEVVLDHMIKTDWYAAKEQPNAVRRHALFAEEVVREALVAAGLEAEPNTWLDNAPVPQALQGLIDEMSLVSQFRAARGLHQLIQEEGESPERLWALSRVYANLGQESRWFIRCQFAAFQARSLLYAQRLSLQSPEHPLSHLALAYAWTMTTHTRHALSQLDAFDALGQAGEPWSQWAELLRACCMYDKAALDQVIEAGGPRQPIAALWTVVTHEFSELDSLTFSAIERAAEVNPLSTRAYYPGYDAMGVSTGHWLTVAALEHFALVTTAQLRRIEAAPDAVQALLPGPQV